MKSVVNTLLQMVFATGESLYIRERLIFQEKVPCVEYKRSSPVVFGSFCPLIVLGLKLKSIFKFAFIAKFIHSVSRLLFKAVCKDLETLVN